jgi:DNA-binding IclR family transcriptional regulator
VEGLANRCKKAIRILLHLGQSRSEVGITQMASALSLHKATVYRLLTAMQKFELIEDPVTLIQTI